MSDDNAGALAVAILAAAQLIREIGKTEAERDRLARFYARELVERVIGNS